MHASQDEQAVAVVAFAVLTVRGVAADAEFNANYHAECSLCAHAREVPGNCHILCAKPDMEMRGIRHGIERGWFMYPLLFDPVWKARACRNFEQSTAVSGAVSHAAQ